MDEADIDFMESLYWNSNPDMIDAAIMDAGEGLCVKLVDDVLFLSIFGGCCIYPGLVCQVVI